MFQTIAPTSPERSEARPGDALVEPADITMDRAFTVPGTPETVWPWIVQLGKQRAGWYLGRRAEWFVPRGRRAIREVDPRWQHLVVGNDIPDYGGRHEIFTVAEIDPPTTLVYVSQRKATAVSWSIVLRPVALEGDEPSRPASTRVLLRLRLGPVKRVWLARTAGELIDLLTIAGLAAGLRERLVPPSG